jgi:hypothetical protein
LPVQQNLDANALKIERYRPRYNEIILSAITDRRTNSRKILHHMKYVPRFSAADAPAVDTIAASQMSARLLFHRAKSGAAQMRYRSTTPSCDEALRLDARPPGSLAAFQEVGLNPEPRPTGEP